MVNLSTYAYRCGRLFLAVGWLSACTVYVPMQGSAPDTPANENLEVPFVGSLSSV